jgi:endo-1,4-beta-xylanase
VLTGIFASAGIWGCGDEEPGAAPGASGNSGTSNAGSTQAGGAAQSNGGTGQAGEVASGGSGETGGSGDAGSGGGAKPACDDLEALKCAAGARRVGTAFNVNAFASEPRYAEVMAREFNAVTPENAMKWGPLQPTADAWDFTEADQLIAEAEQRGLGVRGHVLVWHQQMPQWAQALTGAALVDAVRQHVIEAAQHFKGKVYAWDVVNEALQDAPGHPLRPGIHSALGLEGMAEMFKLAREHDADAKLYYNDYNIEKLNTKSDAVYELVKQLQALGAPIDGVGFQAHLSTKSYASGPAFRANIARFEALGLQVNISELDVRTTEVPGTSQERLAAQAVTYQELASACAAEPACDALTLWGFTDAYSWIDSYFGPDDPLIFDEDFAKKPAYAALHAGLSGMAPQASQNVFAAGDCESLGGWNVFGGAGTLSAEPAGRSGQACRVSGRAQSYQGPSVPLAAFAMQGTTLRITAYAKASIAGARVNMTVKQTAGGTDTYIGLSSRLVRDDDWSLFSGVIALGWNGPPSELTLFFESPAVSPGVFADILVDDLSIESLTASP